MSEQSSRIEYFRTPQDAREAHPRLDLDAAMPKEAFDAITGVYSYDRAHFVICQLEINGQICRQEHGKGWIMRRTDGVEGYIGKDCAHEHFKKDHAFTNAVAHARRQVRTGALIERLRCLLDDPLRRDRIVDGFERQRALLREIRRIRDLLPFVVKETLERVAKGGRNAVWLEFEYLEKDEDKDGNVFEVSRWRPETIGVVDSPSSIDLGRVDSIGEAFRAALTAYDYAKPSPEHPYRTLLGWAESLEALDRCESDLDELSNGLESFLRPMNLQLLCWLCRKESDQVDTVQAVLRLTGSPAGGMAARSAWGAWRREISRAYQDRRFRVP